jgi:hypothetical protein
MESGIVVGWGSIAGLICISILKSWYLYSCNWLFKTLHREKMSTKNIAKIVGPPMPPEHPSHVCIWVQQPGLVSSTSTPRLLLALTPLGRVLSRLPVDVGVGALQSWWVQETGRL